MQSPHDPDIQSVVFQATPGLFGAIVSLRWVPGATVAHKAWNVACGAALAYFAGPPLTAMLALTSPGLGNAVGFGLGLFGVSMTNLVMTTLTDLRPRLVDAASSWLTRR
jgi:hypothetical protein